MSSTTLFDDGTHRNVLLPDHSEGAAVQANQHLIVHGGEGMILDPGGHKIFTKVFSETTSRLGRGGVLKYIFLSHQDPDIVAATNGWLFATEATAYISALWTRFVPHFGLDKLVSSRLRPIPDEGTFLTLGDADLMILPAHFLHSPGNFQIYDPRAKILYSGDLGASLDAPYVEVPRFAEHVKYMEGFHRRYMAGNAVLRAWARMVRELDIEWIAPQHGALFRGRAMANQFIDWIETLECGIDVMTERLRLPRR
jgi:flavorubredoxin